MSYNSWSSETVEILKGAPGGVELLDWFGGEPNFGDGQILELSLTLPGPSRLRVIALSSAGRGHDRAN